MGTGGAPSLEVMEAALLASGTELTTVAMRRVDPGAPGSVLDVLDRHGIAVLPNTAGCYTTADAVLTAQLAREALETDWVKLEVIADEVHPAARPDRAARRGRDGWSPTDSWCCRTPTTTRSWPVGWRTRLRRRDAAGRADRLRARHPQPAQHRADRRRRHVPVVLDAGLGTASEAARAMELGCDAVLLASAVTRAEDPVAMAHAMRLAVQAGRLAAGAGRIPVRRYARASSAPEGRIEPTGVEHDRRVSSGVLQVGS